MDAYAHCRGHRAQRLDRDRYLADLFAPARGAPHLFALHAFNAEVARVRDAVSEPTLGEIRLQWWRDAIASGDGGGNPVAAALIETIATLRRCRSAAFDTAHRGAHLRPL